MSADDKAPGSGEQKSGWVTRAEASSAYLLAVIFLAAVTVAFIQQRRAGQGVRVLKAQGETINYLVDLNRADRYELMLLPQIGEVRANRIIQRRQELGRFQSLEQVQTAAGLSDRAMETLRPLVTLDGGAGSAVTVSRERNGE